VDEEREVGIKTERKRTELSAATFVFIFLCGSRNEYVNTETPKTNMKKDTFGNKYGTNMVWK
jgi:hypothetical protein